MNSMNLMPGQEVVIAGGAVGVLYARTWPAGRRRVGEAPECWYFLPDVRGTAGLVVFGQPREVGEHQVQKVGAVREGAWPAAGHRISGIERQRVYVAHMQRRQLPVPDTAITGA